MEKIKLSRTPIGMSLCWSWILMFIPTLVIAIRISGLKYYYDDKNIIIEKGIFNIRQETIPFYTISDITSGQNFLKYGSVVVRGKTKIVKLSYVNQSLYLADELRTIWEKSKKKNKVKHTEIF